MFLPGSRHELAAHLEALANPTRLRILEYLGDVGETSVNELARHLRMSQPRISWHLSRMRRGGVLRTRRVGRVVYCSLNRDDIRDRLEELEALLRLDEPGRPALKARAAH